MDPASRCPVRLPDLSLPAKLTLTFFLLLIGGGYLVAVTNIYAHHHDADLDPALTVDDLRRTYHGLEKTVTEEVTQVAASEMLEEVSPGGSMRRYLEQGGPASIRSLITWLEDGAKEEAFGRSEHPLPGDPSPKEVLAKCCVECHNLASGDAAEYAYAPDATSEPDYTMVAKLAEPRTGPTESRTETICLAPTGWKELVQITHAHILSIPVFTLIVAGLFLLTDVPSTLKLVIAPLPMFATVLDMASWWLARPIEPFIHVIAASGAIFGTTLGIQILVIAYSLWFGRRSATT